MFLQLFQFECYIIQYKKWVEANVDASGWLRHMIVNTVLDIKIQKQ